MLDFLPPEDGFLEPDRDGARTPEAAKAVVIPFGLEATVSYGGGTAQGPAAILGASHQLELFDEELWCEAYKRYGVATLRPPEIVRPQAAAIEQIGDLVDAVAAAGKFPMVIGGEHALTPGAVRPLAQRHDGLVILQIDAHADLRDGYLGEHYSHASAMRRCLDYDGVSVISVGIRAISQGEVAYLDEAGERVTIYWAKDQAAWNIADIVAPLAGRPLYITFDVDGLNGASMPATGTPVPGGLEYWHAMRILRAAAAAADQVVGADVVELAPQEGLHLCDYTAAAITYKILNYALAER